MADQATAPVGDGFTLDTDTAEHYARAAGLEVVHGSGTALTGGVSSIVVALDGRPPIVVKQALSRLAVEASWDAAPERASTEASALRLTRQVTPDHVPAVLLADPLNHVVVIARAPAAWQNWRDVLLEHPTLVDVDRAHELGRVLGSWHSTTWDDDAVRDAFSDDLAFDQLRIDPFYREIRRRHPDLAASIDPLIAEATGLRQCLVHGDYSPKNVLVGADGFWMLDHEVARVGAAVFDLAFMTSHLMLKAIHRPDAAGMYAAAGAAFLDGYRRENPRPEALAGLGEHVAALLLARVDGKSPAGYLTDADRIRTRDLAVEALGGLEALGPRPVAELWSSVVDAGKDRG